MRNYSFCLLLLLVGCTYEERALPAEETEVGESLPFQRLILEDLSDFNPVGPNWYVAEKVISDHTRENHLQALEGTGLLVNQNTEADKDNLFTNWEHGDLELDVEVIIPKGSNSGIYFQGRYEIQLFDSWQVAKPKHSDLGGIYQRWDEEKPEGQKGFEGHAPKTNAAKAPGLWQHFHIVFRAPRFDKQGNKTENARFEKVVLNGVMIHEGVELSGPTRAAAFQDESPEGPLMIQGDHGPVAIRNLKYKRYFDQGLKLDEIRFQYYEFDGPITQLPDFDALEVVNEGTTDSLVFEKLSERQERIAYVFTGKLNVPKSGEYLFHVYSDDGSQLFIDGNMLIDNDGKHDFEAKRGMIHLSEGIHDFKLTYFNFTWGKGLMVLYEGPNMRLQPLVSRERKQGPPKDRPQVLVTPESAPEMVRSFVMHNGKKITHAISVGDPKGIHYSVDLRRGALLKFWKGGFADVTDMWYQRGHSQLLQPLEMAVENNLSVVASILGSDDAAYPLQENDQFKFKGYDINELDQPVFRYQVGEATVLDHYQPSVDGKELVRTITAERGTDNLYCRIAAEEYIDEVGNGYYSIGGNYYINLKSDDIQPLIRENQGKMEMLFPLSASGEKVQYSILW